MENAVHILFSVALVMLILRTPKLKPYLVALICVSIPITDNYLFTPLVKLGYLSGPVWTHRSITHSLLVGTLLVAIFYYTGFWKSALIGYAAHIVPDFFTGGVKLLLPLSPTNYGLNLNWWLTSAILGLFSAIVILTSFLTLHYPLGFTILKEDENPRGRG
jgi:inner membrane protein